MYNFTFIGTASAFYDREDNFQSNLLIESPNNSKLLIDCGGDARRALKKMALDHTDIDNVFITHLHSDHVGGLEWLAFKRLFSPTTERPNLYCPTPLIPELWEHSLKGGLSSLNEKATLEKYFNVIDCAVDKPFNWEGLSITPIISYHSPNHNEMMLSYSLVIKTKEKTVFFTSDTQFTPEYHHALYHQADVILHDCETSAVPSGVHAHYNDLKQLPPKIKSKIRLFHYQEKNPKDATEDGFYGYINPREPIVLE